MAFSFIQAISIPYYRKKANQGLRQKLEKNKKLYHSDTITDLKHLRVESFNAVQTVSIFTTEMQDIIKQFLLANLPCKWDHYYL